MQNETVTKALEACKALTGLLAEENKELKARNTKRIEEFYKEKRHLAVKMETLLKEVKTLPAEEKNSRNMGELEVAINNYQTHARQNLLLLRAAHEATANFLTLVREAIERKKTKAETYSKEGQISAGDGRDTRLINKNI